MNINTKTKLMGAVLCALGVLSSDFASAANVPQLSYYYGGQEFRHMSRQAEGIMTMFGGLVTKAGKIKEDDQRKEAFKLVYEAMCAYFRLQPKNFNIGNYSNDTTYEDYAQQQTIGDFEAKINAMERFFDIRTDTDREMFSSKGELNRPLWGASLEYGNIQAEILHLGNSIVESLGLDTEAGNCVTAITIAGDLNVADTQAKKDALMFFRCIRSSMSSNNFGFSMITPEGRMFTEFVINTLR